jgi:hypothetical protein
MSYALVAMIVAATIVKIEVRKMIWRTFFGTPPSLMRRHAWIYHRARLNCALVRNQLEAVPSHGRAGQEADETVEKCHLPQRAFITFPHDVVGDMNEWSSATF